MLTTFPNWRAVGRAMRWARQQPTIKADATTEITMARVTDNRWRSVPNGVSVVARHAVGYERTDVEIRRCDLVLALYEVQDVAELLRILTALGLIPAELAELRDERYTRCITCRRILAWAGSDTYWPDRWVHVDQIRFMQDGPHRAQPEVQVLSARATGNAESEAGR